MDSAAISIINILTGAIVNLISASDNDNVIVREVSIYITDEMTYCENFLKGKYLNTGQ